jgi:hypothetical protein
MTMTMTGFNKSVKEDCLMPTQRPLPLAIFALAIIVFLTFFPTDGEASSDKKLSSGETVYVPVYSNIYTGPKAVPLQLAVVLSLRNTDPKHAITILRADYYDSDGKMIESFIKQPIALKPLASTYFYIKEYDTRGGPGASFLVGWRSENSVNCPIIEGVMIGVLSGHGVSFISRGEAISVPRD